MFSIVNNAIIFFFTWGHKESREEKYQICPILKGWMGLDEQVSGKLGVVSPDKLILTQFNYDGLGPAAFFLAGASKWMWKQEWKHNTIGSACKLVFFKVFTFQGRSFPHLKFLQVHLASREARAPSYPSHGMGRHTATIPEGQLK